MSTQSDDDLRDEYDFAADDLSRGERGRYVERLRGASINPEAVMSTYHEAPPHPTGTPFDPAALVRACVESGAHALLLDERALPPEFFDLSTRLAGDLVQRVTLYHIRMAGVVPDPSVHSQSFQDFAREADRGGSFRFFPSREAAVAWLGAEEAG